MDLLCGVCHCFWESVNNNNKISLTFNQRLELMEELDDRGLTMTVMERRELTYKGQQRNGEFMDTQAIKVGT